MITTNRLAFAAAFGPALFLLTPPAVEDLAFAPKDGTTVAKSFDTSFDFELDDFTMTVDGQDIGEMMGSFEMSMAFGQTVDVTDTFVAVSGGRPQKLKRRFDKIDATTSFSAVTDFGGDDQESSSDSDLQGATVVFAWNSEEDGYDVAFDEEDGDSELLDGLEENMDLRMFLPSSAVSEGDTWEVDLENLSPILSPGGDLALANEDVSDEDMAMFEELVEEGLGEELSELFEGQCVCTFVGVEEQEGSRIAEIGIEYEITSSADLSDVLSDLIEELSGEFGDTDVDITIDTANFDLDVEGKGTLLWNLDAGHVAAFEVSGDLNCAIEVSVTGEMDGEGGTVDVTAELSGSMRQEVTTDAR